MKPLTFDEYVEKYHKDNDGGYTLQEVEVLYEQYRSDEVYEGMKKATAATVAE